MYVEWLKIAEQQELDAIREARRQTRKTKHMQKRKGRIDPRTNRPGKRK